MKTVSLHIAALMVMNSVTAMTAVCQTYHFTTPINAWAEVDLSFGGGSTGGRNMVFGTLQETLFYDPVANTLRQVGTVSLSQSSFSFGIGGNGNYGDSHGIADLTITGGGVIEFDTGTLPHFGANSWYWTLNIPVTGTASGVYYGNSFSTPLSYSYPLPILTSLLSATPDALTLKESFASGSQFGVAQGRMICDSIPLFNSTSDGTYWYNWSLPSVTATTMPEPNVLSILGCSLLALSRLRRRRLG